MIKNINAVECFLTRFPMALKQFKADSSTIDLGNNDVGVSATKALAEVLRDDEVVTTIILGDNFIGDIGAKALVDVLKINTTVTVIAIWENHIGVECAFAINEFLEENKRIFQFRKEIFAMVALNDNGKITVPHDALLEISSILGVCREKAIKIIEGAALEMNTKKEIYEEIPEDLKAEIPFLEWLLMVKM